MLENHLAGVEGLVGAVFGLVALPFIRKRNDSWVDVVKTTNRPLWIIRFFAAGTGAVGSVTAFTHLSMAEAFALIFLLHSFVTIMSVVFLKEQVGIKRWSAVIIGFVGVLIMLSPHLSAGTLSKGFQAGPALGAALGLAGAFCSAFAFP